MFLSTTTTQEAVMSIATQAQKSAQAHVVQATAQATTNPLVVSFDRFVSLVKGTPCTQAGHPNGHTTQANGTLCAQARAQEFLATLPDSTTQDEALASLGEVTLVTIPRFMCLNHPATEGQPLDLKCKFGHKTQAQAEAHVGTQATPKARAASLVQVTLGGTLAATQATTQAQAQEPTQATQEPTQEPTQAKPTQAKPRLKSGTQGQVGGKAN